MKMFLLCLLVTFSSMILVANIGLLIRLIYEGIYSKYLIAKVIIIFNRLIFMLPILPFIFLYFFMSNKLNNLDDEKEVKITILTRLILIFKIPSLCLKVVETFPAKYEELIRDMKQIDYIAKKILNELMADYRLVAKETYRSVRIRNA
ncbi:hypothetical protein [Paenibacillus ehimensis]|uniref:hypothetical protein n=1 Tax=Paenibacillus ehimensis TaxID=79264 RepID=UPI000FD8345A|nr:hypothetical protein [Paenibacillus ehimensis]